MHLGWGNACWLDPHQPPLHPCAPLASLSLRRCGPSRPTSTTCRDTTSAPSTPTCSVPTSTAPASARSRCAALRRRTSGCWQASRSCCKTILLEGMLCMWQTLPACKRSKANGWSRFPQRFRPPPVFLSCVCNRKGRVFGCLSAIVIGKRKTRGEEHTTARGRRVLAFQGLACASLGRVRRSRSHTGPRAAGLAAPPSAWELPWVPKPVTLLLLLGGPGPVTRRAAPGGGAGLPAPRAAACLAGVLQRGSCPLTLHHPGI
jgi:hypothetical protein